MGLESVDSALGFRVGVSFLGSGLGLEPRFLGSGSSSDEELIIFFFLSEFDFRIGSFSFLSALAERFYAVGILE